MVSKIQIEVILAIIFIVLLSFIIKFILKEKYPYKKVDSIVTDNEKRFLNVLLSIVENDVYVFSKVRLADIVNVKSGTRKYIKYFSRIQSKHIDFLLCDSYTFEPLLAIELDDSSHLRDDVKERDNVKDRILEAAKLPLLRVKSRKHYDIEEIEDEINELI